MLVEERLRHLSDQQRTPRQYKKMATDYWSNGIRENRRKRPRLCTQAENDEDDYLHLTQEDLRSRMKDLGVKT